MLRHAGRVRYLPCRRADISQQAEQRERSPLPRRRAFESHPHGAQFGLGTAVPVRSLASAYDGKLALVWADGTNGTGSHPSAEEIIAHVTRGFTGRQLGGVRRLADPSAIPGACPQNFNLFSECFAAVAFNSLPGPGGALPLNYTLRADAGLFHVDVAKHRSDYEQRLLPLQWAIDSVRGASGLALRLRVRLMRA